MSHEVLDILSEGDPVEIVWVDSGFSRMSGGWQEKGDLVKGIKASVMQARTLGFYLQHDEDIVLVAMTKDNDTELPGYLNAQAVLIDCIRDIRVLG